MCQVSSFKVLWYINYLCGVEKHGNNFHQKKRENVLISLLQNSKMATVFHTWVHKYEHTNTDINWTWTACGLESFSKVNEWNTWNLSAGATVVSPISSLQFRWGSLSTSKTLTPLLLPSMPSPFQYHLEVEDISPKPETLSQASFKFQITSFSDWAK